ncbi:uncharacterized protein [Haliotis asinina]|uniref:uncharacterized protein isoform X1 n=1 Tax=Haliotis asinina TaxID=109174 RepID=UPI003531D814
MASKCRKFVPNIFNKTKCQNCFGAKENHSAEALENNKASRKVSKCGYLFVSPGFDFNNPLDRTRRWQRRFFVLYDDAELTWSVDDNPDTVPQGTIDMNKCSDVQEAEKVTGHINSVSVMTPDKTIYIKGESKEESQWWYDVLIEFPRSMNAILKPRRKSTLGLCNKENVQPEGSNKKVEDGKDILKGRFEVEKVKGKSDMPTFSTFKGVRSLKHKYDKNYQDGLRKSSSLHDLSSEDKKVDSDLVSSRFLSRSGDRLDYVSKNNSLYNISGHSKILSDSKYTSNPYFTLPRVNRSPALLLPKPYPGATSTPVSSATAHSNRRSSFDDRPQRKNPTAAERARQHRERSTSMKDFPTQLSLPRDDGSGEILSKVQDDGASETMSTDETESNETDELKMARSSEMSAVNRAHSLASTPVSPDSKGTKYEDLVYMKKGWLIKQGPLDKDMKKHWFVLAGNSLRYFRDAKAEDMNSLDGRIDLSTCYEVSEVNTARNYGFKIKTRNGEYNLAAMTSGIRNNWMKAIRLCMDLHSSGRTHSMPSSTLTSKSLTGARAVDDFDVAATSSQTTTVTGSMGETAFQLVGRREQTKKDTKNTRRHHSDVNPGNVSKAFSVKEFSSSLDQVPAGTSSSNQSIGSDRSTQSMEYEHSNVESKGSPRLSRGTKIPRHHIPPQDLTWQSGNNPPLKRYVEGSDNAPTAPGGDTTRVPKRSIMSESSKEEEQREKMRRGMSPSARVKEKTRPAKAARMHSPPPSDDPYHFNLSSSSKETYSGDSDNDEVDMGDRSLSQDQFNDEQMRSEDDDNMMGGASSGSISDGGGVLVEFLETEVESLKDRLEKSQHDLAKMHETNRDLKSRLHTSSSQSHHMENPYVSGGRWGQQQSQYDASQVQGMKKQMKDAKDTVQKQKSEIDNLKSKLDMSVSKLTGTEKALSEALKNLKQEKDRFIKLTSEWNRRIRTLETELKDKSLKLERSRESLLSKERECQHLESDVKGQQQKCREQEREILRMKAVESEYKQLKEKLESKEKELLAMQKLLKEKELECKKVAESYEKQIEEMEKEYGHERDDLENHLEQMKAQLCQAHERQTTMKDSITSNISDLMREKNEIISQLEEKLIENEKKMEDMSENFQAMMAENTELVHSIESLQDEKTRLQDKLGEMEKYLDGLHDKITHYEPDNVSLRKHMDELRKENQLLSEKLSSEKKSYSQHQREKEELQKTIQDLNKQIQGLQLRLIERFEDIDHAHLSRSSSRGDSQELLHSVLIMDAELKEINAMLLELRQNFDAYLDSLQGESRTKFTSLADMIEDIGRKCHSVQEILKDSVDPSLAESVGSDYKHDIKVDSSSESHVIMTEYGSLKDKFDCAVAELKKLRKEVNDVYRSCDKLESEDQRLREKVKKMEEGYKSQLEQVIKKADMLSAQVGVRGGGRLSQSSSHETIPSDLSANIEQQLNNLEQKLLLVEKSITDNETKASSGTVKTQSSSRLSLSPGDSQNIVQKLKEMKAQLEKSNSHLSSIAKSITINTDKMDTSETAGAESLQSRIDKYGKKIDSLASKIEQGSKQMSGNPHGVGGPQDSAAVDECFREIKEKLQEINEQLDGLEEDSDSDDEEQEQITVEDVRERVANLMGYLEQHSNMTQADWNILGMLQRQLVSSDKTTTSTEELSSGDKLLLYSDRLAMEAVILQEMSVLLSDEYGDENRDTVLKEIDAHNCHMLLTQQMIEKETQSMHIERKEDVMRSYACLLAEKIVLEDQLLSPAVDQNESMEDDSSLGLSRPRVLAKEALIRSQLDAHINNCLEKSLNVLDPVSTHMITKSLIQGELTYALNTIKETLVSFDRQGGVDMCKKRRDFLYRQMKARERVLVNLVEEYQVQMVKSLAVIIAKEGEEVTVFEGAESVLEDVCSEISTVMEKHIQSHKENVRYAEDTETAHKHDLIVDTLRADREKVLAAIRLEHTNYASQEEPRSDDVELPLQSVDTTIENFGQIMVQNAVMKATSVFVSELYAKEDLSLDVDSSDDESVVSEFEADKSINIFVKSLSGILAKEASSKRTLAAQLANNTPETPGNIVGRIPDVSKYPPRLSRYADSIVRESVFQAQLTYTLHKAKLQHDSELEQLKHDYPLRKPEIMHEESRDSDIDFHGVLLPLEEVMENKYEDELEVLQVIDKQVTVLKDVVKDAKSRNWSQVEDQLRLLEETFQHQMVAAQERHDVQMEVFKQELMKVERMWEDRENERVGFEGECGQLHVYLESMRANHDEEVERMKQDVMTAVSAIRANEETQMIAQVQKLKEQLATQTENLKTFLEDVKKESSKASQPDLVRKVEQQLVQLHSTAMSLDLETIPVMPKPSVPDSAEGNQPAVNVSPTVEAGRGEKVMDLCQHDNEFEQLKREKEEALAEEMRNTKAALDAMRKAYEEELGEEKEKYREALMTMYTDDYVNEFKSRHQHEMEKMSEELAQVQMHYQSKCEDYKLLEVKLEQTKQEYENHYKQLILSNDHLNMMLNKEIDGLKDFIRNKPNMSSGGGTMEEDLFDAQILIRVKDAELQKLRSQVKNFENSLQRSTEEHRQAMTQYLQVLKENHELKAQVQKEKHEESHESSSKRPIRRTPSFHQRARSPSPQPTQTSKKDSEHSSRDSHRRRRIGPQDLRRSKSSPSLPYVFDAKSLRPKDAGKAAAKSTGKEAAGRSPRGVKAGKH